MFLSSDYGKAQSTHHSLGEVIEMQSPKEGGGSMVFIPSKKAWDLSKAFDQQEFNEATIANLFLLGTIVLLGKPFDKEIEKRLGIPDAVPDVLSAALLGVLANSVSASVATAITGGKPSFFATILASSITALPFAGLIYSLSIKPKERKWTDFQIRSGLGLSLMISVGLSVLMNRGVKKSLGNTLLATSKIK